MLLCCVSNFDYVMICGFSVSIFDIVLGRCCSVCRCFFFVLLFNCLCICVSDNVSRNSVMSCVVNVFVDVMLILIFVCVMNCSVYLCISVFVVML